MNKRVITALIMLGVVFVMGICSLLTTSRIVADVCENAKQLQQTPDNAEMLKLFEKQWDKYEKILSFYTRHSEIENIGGSVRALDSLRREDEALFRIECDKIVTAANHLKSTERPYLRNIF